MDILLKPAFLFRVLCCTAAVLAQFMLASPLLAQAGDSPGPIIVLIVDGLRPDAINPEDTPNLYKLRREGVSFTNSHAVFPTVTRVNATSLATGDYPARHGVVSNSMHVRQVLPARAFSTGDYRNLIKLDQVSGGHLILVRSLGEILRDHDLKLAAISSGSSGSAFLQNHRAPAGAGYLINGYFEPGRVVAFPESINIAILERFGPAPEKVDSLNYVQAVNWTQNVLYEYVLPELRPQVVFNWLTEPDHSQHRFGTGSEPALAAIRNDDRQVGLLLKKLEQLHLYESANLFVISDHGMSQDVFAVNVAQELIRAGLKASENSADVVIASSGQAVLLHVQNHDRERINRLVDFLQQQDWVEVIFTPAKESTPVGSGVPALDRVDPEGIVAGTFSLDLIHAGNRERRPDVLFTFRWSSDKNAFGYAGTSYRITAGRTGEITNAGDGHGNLSPWCIRNTMFAWGASFKSGIAVETPACNVDVVPTILHLLGVRADHEFDGRVLHEALKGGPDREKIATAVETITTRSTSNGYQAVIQISRVGESWYVDKGWRNR